MSLLLGFIAAQADSIELSGDHVWGKQFQAERHTCVRFLIRNPGRPFSGALVLIWGQGSGLPSGDMRPETLPGAGRATFSVAMNLPEKSQRRQFVVVPSEEEDSLWAFLVDGEGNIRGRSQVGGTPVTKGKGVVGVIGPGILYGLGQAHARGSGQTGGFSAVTVRPGDLPDQWAGYDPLDALLWMDGDPTVMSPAQREALRLWVGQGGTLVLASPHRSWIASSFLGELFDLNGVRETETDVLDLPGKRIAVSPAVPILEGESRSAISRRPFIDLRSYGIGRVALAGFDPCLPALSGEPALAAIWEKLIPPPPSPSSEYARWNSRVEDAALLFPGVRTPRVGWLLAFLLLYGLLVGPIEYLIWRWKKRFEWTWVSYSAVTLAFAAGMIGTAAAYPAASRVEKRMAIVDSIPGGVERDLWIDSVFLPRGGEVTVRTAPSTHLELRDKESLWWGGRTRGMQSWNLRSDGGWEIRGWELNRAMGAIAKAKNVRLASPRLLAERRRSPDGREELIVRNGWGSAIAEAAVAAADGFRNLGPVLPGESRHDLGRVMASRPHRDPDPGDRLWGVDTRGYIIRRAQELLEEISFGSSMRDPDAQYSLRTMSAKDWLDRGGLVLFGFLSGGAEAPVAISPGGSDRLDVILVRAFVE